MGVGKLGGELNGRKTNQCMREARAEQVREFGDELRTRMINQCMREASFSHALIDLPGA